MTTDPNNPEKPDTVKQLSGEEFIDKIRGENIRVKYRLGVPWSEEFRKLISELVVLQREGIILSLQVDAE